MSKQKITMRLKALGIDTYTEPVIYMNKDSYICRSEGFMAQARVRVSLKGRSLIATLHTVGVELLEKNEASLSRYAWNFLNAEPEDEIIISHPKPLESLEYIRSKVYGHRLTAEQIQLIVKDIISGRLSDIHIAMFLAAAAGKGFNEEEILDLTQSMIRSGSTLSWPASLIVDKHCIGGIPGNRTTLIAVPIVAAFGLMMPKTSSRAITSPAGTADTMEVFAPVDLNIKSMRKVVEKENACIVWGGTVALSPADDLVIRVERSMNLDSEGQMVASILSKKIAAGSNHLLIDVPIGPCSKVRSMDQAIALRETLTRLASNFSLTVKIIFSDGSQPIGRGIGPALEARDVLAVLKNDPQAPQDLRQHALQLAAGLIEFSPDVAPGKGLEIAQKILESGKAFQKFEAICKAQGGMFKIPTAAFTHTLLAEKSGRVKHINNRYIAELARLTGAPMYKAAGIELLAKVDACVEKDQPLLILHAATEGQLNYALAFLEREYEVIAIEEAE